MRRQADLPGNLFLRTLPHHDNLIVWEQVYQKYAPLIYGIILNMTGDKRIASEIFKDAFVDLKRKRILSRNHITLCQTLLRYAHKLTLKYLQLRGRVPANPSPFQSKFRLLNMLYCELISTKEAAQKLNMSEQEVLLHLRMEFNQLRRMAWEKSPQAKLEMSVLN